MQRFQTPNKNSIHKMQSLEACGSVEVYVGFVYVNTQAVVNA